MNKIGKCLMLIGIVIMLIPIIGRVYVTTKEKQLYDNYKRSLQVAQNEQVVITNKPIEKNIVEENSVVEEEKQDQVEEEVWQCPIDVEEGEILGRIVIHKIDVDMLLSEGTKNEELGIGAGHMIETALPGQEGNCAIAGHRNYVFGSMFNRLDEIQVDDTVEVELKGKNFIYKVTEIMIVDPDDLTVLAQDLQVKELTLITCHPVYSSAHRLIIKAVLVED